MKKLTRFIAAATCAVMLLSSCGSTQSENMRDISTFDLVQDMGMGINLGNTFDCAGDWIAKDAVSVQTAWGSPVITKEIIQCYADAGFGVMRFPVSWNTLIDDDGTVHKDFIDNVQQVVDWILDSGMYCILNSHHDGWSEAFTDDYDAAMAKYEYLWKQISDRFKDYGDKLMFESMNEVGFDEIWNQYAGDDGKDKAFEMFNGINQKFVDTVRASGGNNPYRHLLIASYWTSIERACDSQFKMPKDPAKRLAVSVHYYGPSTLCLISEDVSWGKAKTDWGSTEDYDELNMWFDMMKENYTDKGIPVIVGEYGCFGENKTLETRQKWTLDVAEAARFRKMCPVLWDTPGGELGRDALRWWHEDFIKELVAVNDKY